MSRVNPRWLNEYEHAEAINELDERLAYERRERSGLAHRFASEQAEVRGHLEQVGSRVHSVTERVGAVFEWTELRFQLLEFDEHQARKEIRKTFRALTHGLPAAPPAVDDIPGYWLPPAALAVLRAQDTADISDHRPGAGSITNLPPGLASAHERDPIRTDLFTLAAGLCFDRPAFVGAAVPRLLAEPAGFGMTEAGQVAVGWRTLWELAAGGTFGPAAAQQVSDRLATLFDPAALDAEELAAWDRAIEMFGSTGARTPTKVEAFTALHSHLTAEPVSTEPIAAQSHSDWRGYLLELIEEPSHAERPLVQAMERLHVPAGQLRRSAPRWAASAGTVAALIRSDLFGYATPIPLRRLALRIGAPLLRARLGAALVAPEPVVTTIERRGTTIVVTSQGHDPEQCAIVERRIAASYDADLSSRSNTVPAVFVAGLASLAVVIAVFGQWLPAILCAAGAFIAVWTYLGNRNHARDAAARRDSQLAETRSALARAQENNAAEERRLAAQYTTGRPALDRLIASLPGSRG